MREFITKIPQEGTGTAGEPLPEPSSGSSIVSGGGKIPNDGDAICHSSRLVSPKGRKRARECLYATVNVCGAVDGKMSEICEMMDVRRIDVLGVTETKRKGCAETTYGQYIVYWSGVEESQRASQGVGILLNKKMNECLKEYKQVSPRLLWARLKVGLMNIFILCVYAPDMSKPLSVREEFWDTVRDVLDKCQPNERIIMLGDFNGWVGVRRDGYERILGKYGDDKVNENGEKILELCLEKNLIVTNTIFDHKKIHMYTWQRQSERSMIDFIIVDERLITKVVDTRVYRGINVGTDHFLVVSRITGLLKRWRHYPQVNTPGLARIKVERMEEKDVRVKYEKKLSERLTKLLESEIGEIEETWTELKDGIVESAEEVCGLSKKKNAKNPRNEWWDDDVKRVIAEKRKAWTDFLSAKANSRLRSDMEGSENVARMKYNRLKKIVKEVVLRKKEEYKDKYDRRFSTNFRSNVKLFWHTVRKARGKARESLVGLIRDKNGHIIRDQNKILNEWKKYFESVFECEEEMEGSDRIFHEEFDSESDISMETWMDDVRNAMKHMKVGKAAGYDRISAEMLKGGGEIIFNLLCRLFDKCWREGRVPKDWCKAVIVPLFKGKGSKHECKNYRGISLLSVVGKLYAKILIERVMRETYDKMWDVQAGFRKGRGCVDQVFSLRCIAEKALEKHQKVFCAFIDLEKAYDRVVRDDLWSTLSMYGVDGNLIRALKSLYTESSACVRLDGTCTDWFSIKRGVRQGCVASPWLFNLFMDSCLTDLKVSDCGFRMDKSLFRCLLYADDQVLLASSACDLQRMVTIMNDAFKRRGMKVNVKKTKVMVLERDVSRTECKVTIESEEVEQVDEFVYLGSLFTRDGKCEKDIERRVKMGNSVNGALYSITANKNISHRARLAIHQGVLVPTLMYGCESWVWQKKHESRINAVEMRALRSMCGVKLVDRVKNSVIREKCGLKEDVVTKIEKGMLRWFGHMERMDARRLTKEIYDAKMDGGVGRGRPRKTYKNHIEDLLKKGKIRSPRNRRACMQRLMTVDEAKEVCMDRSTWRSIVSAYPNGT